jgi:hypothetical protein
MKLYIYFVRLVTTKVHLIEVHILLYRKKLQRVKKLKESIRILYLMCNRKIFIYFRLVLLVK